jgi:uncharacterized membrane protein
MEASSHISSVGKSAVWRLMGVVVKALVTYVFTRNWITTSLITIVHHATFLVVFYLHERAWYRVKIDLGNRRNVLKAFTYEIILGMGIGGLIIYIFTDSWLQVTYQTLVYTAIKLVMYYFYDRVWK